MKLVHTNKFEANKWLITARWFYAPAIFAMGLLSKVDPFGNGVFPVPTMIFLFSLFILTNVMFWILVQRIEILDQRKYLNFLGTGQIVSELIFFSIILHLSGGVESVAPIFFFIPIVSSIVLFNPLGSLFIAFLSGLLVNGTILLEYFGISQKLPGYAGRGVIEFQEILVMLSSTVIITAVYFIVGALSGYLSSVIKRRETLLSESKRKAQLQAEKLRLLNEEYNNFARKLVRQDMELKRETQEAEELSREKSEFVSTVAHQLRTPLSAIKWTLNALLNESSSNFTSDQKALLLKAYESNDRIINLIQDMLGSDRAESQTGLSLVEINIPDLINNVIPDFKSTVEKKGLKITVHTEKDLPKIKADPQKMRAVFQNLLENAVKYSNRKGVIKIELNKEDNFLKVVFEDNGIGIPKEQQSDIFKKFFRAKNAMQVDNTGSGLGLFIVKSIIERHGGKIDFESEENKGTKFIFTLPLNK